ncbi:MAG: 4-hydroxythreonine-4-phosphate dehydrogenase PdxA [Aestuariivirga sp.]
MAPRPIALTCGEPAGIAPEITAMAWRKLRGDPRQCFFLLGDAAYFETRARLAGVEIPVQRINAPSEAANMFGYALPVIDLPLPKPPLAGHIEGTSASTVIAAIDKSVAIALKGEASAIVTNPIHKDALYQAGFRHQGHTDYLAHLARSQGHEAHDVMMLVARDLRAVPVTVHIPLAEVAAQLTTEMIVAQARVVEGALKNHFGVVAPRLAVTGLNPHAGENGAMGREEITIIAPAVEKLRAEGMSVIGPLSADTAFHAEARRGYDAILCMYHDQALIPVKTIDFHGGVNVTLGLPFIRTSPDHGTALEIAGTGKANPSSLIAAIELAASMARA